MIAHERTVYSLARSVRTGDAAALSTLIDALTQRSSGGGRRSASHALTAAGADAVAPLLAVISAGIDARDWECAVCAADAVGEAAAATPSVELIQWLARTAEALHRDQVPFPFNESYIYIAMTMFSDRKFPKDWDLLYDSDGFLSRRHNCDIDLCHEAGSGRER